MTALRYGFLGSPPFATDVLAALLESGRVPRIVVTQPSRPAGRGREIAASPVVELATAHGIAVRQPESSKDATLRAELAALELDVLLVASYGELLDQAFLDLPRRLCLNVHGSLLPRWRGASPVQAAIAAGDEVSGVSIQRVVKKLDAGDVLLALETPITPKTTGGELFARLAKLGGEAAVQALSIVERGAERFVPQDTTRVTHCTKLSKESGAIDWSRPAVEIERLVRAMDPWPGAATSLPTAATSLPAAAASLPAAAASLPAAAASLPAAATSQPSGDRLVVWRAELAPGTAAHMAPSQLAPGTASVHGDDLFVATGAGVLRLVEIQAAGKKRMSSGAWLRGARFAGGVVLGLTSRTN